MARKILFQTALTDVESSDIEGLGVERDDEQGNVYRWVKNASATALVEDGCSLQKLTSVAEGALKYVLSPNAIATGPTTCMITMPAGVPMSGIGATGSSTGCYGWVKKSGTHRVSIRQLSTAVDQQAGCVAIATTICVTNSEWGQAVTSVVDSTIGGLMAPFRITLLQSLASTGVATVASALALIQCP